MYQMLFTTSSELEYLVDIDVLLNRRLDQPDAQLAAELLHLEAVHLGPVEEVQLGHDQHHGDVAALLLHLLLPLGHALETLPVHAGEGEHAGLGPPGTATINTIPPPTEFHGSFVTSRSHFCVLSDSYQTILMYFSGHKSPLTMCEDTDL